MPKLRLDNKKEGEGEVVPPVVPPKDESIPASNDPPIEGEGDNLDELGYAPHVEEEGDSKKAGDPEKKKPTEEKPEEVKDPATGYGAEPPVVEDVPIKKEDAPPPTPHELDPVLKDLPEKESLKVKEFVEKHKVSPEIAKAYAEMRKEELKEHSALVAAKQKEAEQEVIRTRAAWDKELRNDPVFGGDKFTANISRAEKVLEEFMPSTKKALTGKGSMLPPYVMRDLAKLGDLLYSTPKLVQGDPKTKEVDEKETDDALAFYT